MADDQHKNASKPTKNDVFGLVVWIIVVFAFATAGSFATSSGLGEWYESLEKPWFQPPSWIFGPVWTCLYLMMAVAAWLVTRQSGSETSTSPRFFVVVFLVQLLLNMLWSILFFHFKLIDVAFFEICLLWIAISVTTFLAFRYNRWSGNLLVPYLCWCSFASVLNFAIWRLNS